MLEGRPLTLAQRTRLFKLSETAAAWREGCCGGLRRSGLNWRCKTCRSVNYQRWSLMWMTEACEVLVMTAGRSQLINKNSGMQHQLATVLRQTSFVCPILFARRNAPPLSSRTLSLLKECGIDSTLWPYSSHACFRISGHLRLASLLTSLQDKEHFGSLLQSSIRNRSGPG